MTHYSSTIPVRPSPLQLEIAEFFVGHGGQTRDLDGDEDGGYDEVIYPVDFRKNGHIVDDEMHKIMVQPLKAGVRLTAIFDSCHSATAFDLPYIYSTQGLLKEPNLAKEAGQGLLSVISSYSGGSRTGVANNLLGFFNKITTKDDTRNKTLATKTKTSPADVIMWSSRGNYQTSLVHLIHYFSKDLHRKWKIKEISKEIGNPLFP
jgi:metacaspase-1